jgi:hypothetical protein
MNENLNNPSAFPWVVDDGEKVKGQKGMTLRDYFAAMAMQGMLANSEWGGSYISVSGDAYRMADKMLEARKQ